MPNTTHPTTHTPGPWIVDSFGRIGTDPSTGRLETIATTPQAFIDNTILDNRHDTSKAEWLNEWRDRTVANATLIAAAPALLEAAQAAIDAWHSNDRNFLKAEPEWLKLTRLAIAQATGR